MPRRLFEPSAPANCYLYRALRTFARVGALLLIARVRARCVRSSLRPFVHLLSRSRAHSPLSSNSGRAIMKSNDAVAILHKGGGLHAVRVRRTPLPSSHLNALGGLKVETTTTTMPSPPTTTTTSLYICIYCSPHAFAFSYASLLCTRKNAAPTRNAPPHRRSMDRAGDRSRDEKDSSLPSCQRAIVTSGLKNGKKLDHRRITRTRWHN